MSETLNKINSQIRQALSFIIHERYPQYLCSITEVIADSDLECAKVFVGSSLQDSGQFIKVLNNEAKAIRYELAHRVSLRKTPQVIFYEDKSGHQYDHLDHIISSLPHNA